MSAARKQLALVISVLAFVATACPPDPGNPTAPTTTIGPVSSPAVQVTTGYGFSCARLGNNTVKCWGHNAQGSLGNGTTVASNVPVPVTGLSGVAQLTSGGGHSCALILGGTVKCWGLSISGEVGFPASPTPYSTVPGQVTGLVGVASVAAGLQHTCALILDNSVKCWGAAASGQLGDGVSMNSTITPMTVVGINDAVKITAGGSHSCAIVGSGAVKCWGNNFYGQLGDGNDQTYRQSTPVLAVGVSGATEITAGRYHTCALVAGGAVKCWGLNSYGQIGNGTLTDAYTATAVTGITGAIGISASERHTCALFPDNSAKCWGDNEFFQLGDGTGVDRTAPVPVANLNDGVGIAAGGNHTCALVISGHLRCWGSDSDGQLGVAQAYGPLGSDTPAVVVGIP